MHCIPSASVAFRRSNRKTPADDTRLIKAEAAHILQPKCHLRPADELSAPGYTAEAKRLLLEAAMLEPEADFVRDRIKALP
jgi:hypothetical protein